MAFPVIASSSPTSDTDGSTTVVNMPPGIVAGNLLLVLAAHNNNNLLAAAGWTSLALQANGPNVSLAIYAKIAVGGDTCTLTDSGDDTAALALRVIGHNVLNVATDIVIGTTATGSSTNPNPPTSNPGIARDHLWIELFASEDDDNAGTYWSTNYTGVAQVESAQSTTSCMVSVAFRNLNAASENPGSMTMSGSNPWLAQTLAIPPAIPAALEALVSADGIVSPAALTTQIALEAELLGAAMLASMLATQIALAGVLDASGSIVTPLTTQIPLSVSIPVSALIAALVTNEITLVGTVEGAGTLNAALLTQIPLAGVSNGQATLSDPDLTFFVIELVGSSAGSVFVAGDLFTSIVMQAISAQGFTAGGLLSNVTVPGVSAEGLFLSEVFTEGFSVA